MLMKLIFILFISIDTFLNGNLVSVSKKSTQTDIPLVANLVYPPSYCNDGDYDTFCHTSANNLAYWAVDLAGEFSISHIILYNRKDCCRERLNGAVVELLSKNNEVIHVCGSINSTSYIHVLQCKSKKAEKIRVRHTRKEALHFGELEAYADCQM